MYSLMRRQLSALLEGCPLPLPALANCAALLWHSIADINWAGFYLACGDKLVLGPFQGKVACIRIPVGKGVCGTAVAENRTLRVPDVHALPGHIACDVASRSEIVVPIRKDGEVWGVLDVDSPIPNRFTPEDQAGLERVVRILEDVLE